MARIVSEEDLKRFEALERAAHEELLEKRVTRCIAIIDQCHKISIWHKIKEKLFGKCKICKELEGLR